MTTRPEHTGPPEIYYGFNESKKYSKNSRIQQIQNTMANRALELLNLPSDKSAFLLDIGCGSGLSGQVIEDQGHYWCGMDVSADMLDVALDNEVEGDLFLSDIGQGVPFRAGTFDGCISISVIQWLCNADKSHHHPKARLLRFFSTLYSSLSMGSRAVFQFYPENADQIELIVSSATRAGFTGGLVIDYPNSAKAKKYYLCLFAGYSHDQAGKTPELPAALGTGEDDREPSVMYASKRDTREVRREKGGKRAAIKDKDWILKKKELNKRRGKAVPHDSKFTARKRRPKF